MRSVKRAYASRIRVLSNLLDIQDEPDDRQVRGYKPVTVPLDEDEEEKKYDPNYNNPFKKDKDNNALREFSRIRPFAKFDKKLKGQPGVVKAHHAMTMDEIEQEMQKFDEDRDIVKIVVEIRKLKEQIDALSNRDYVSLSDGQQVLSKSSFNKNTAVPPGSGNSKHRPVLAEEKKRPNTHQNHVDNRIGLQR